MGLKLFWSPISPPCRTVQFVISALNLNVGYQYVDILTKRYLTSELSKVNPQHTIPTLVDDGFVIWDSHAISIYLIQKYASNLYLYSNEHDQRALIHQRLHFDSGVLYPCLTNSVLPLLFGGQKSLQTRHATSIWQAYDFMEKFLQRRKWIADDHLTVADFSILTTLSTLDHLLPINKKKTPKLHYYLKLCQSLPYYKEINQNGLNKFGKIIQGKVSAYPSKSK